MSQELLPEHPRCGCNTTPEQHAHHKEQVHRIGQEIYDTISTECVEEDMCGLSAIVVLMIVAYNVAIAAEYEVPNAVILEALALVNEILHSGPAKEGMN